MANSIKSFIRKIKRSIVESNLGKKLLIENSLLPIEFRVFLDPSNLLSLMKPLMKPLENDKTFFVKIGANDGVTGDPIYFFINRYRWQGVCVEPVKTFFMELQQNYKQFNQIILENVAIVNNSAIKEKLFYYLNIKQADYQENNIPIWAKGLGSFDIEHILKHKKLIPDIENYIVSEKLSCMTIEQLLKKHKVSKIDFLHIDTEGYDYEIIKSIDYNQIKPSIILYEHIHLSINDKINCIYY